MIVESEFFLSKANNSESRFKNINDINNYLMKEAKNKREEKAKSNRL